MVTNDKRGSGIGNAVQRVAAWGRALGQRLRPLPARWASQAQRLLPGLRAVGSAFARSLQRGRRWAAGHQKAVVRGGAAAALGLMLLFAAIPGATPAERQVERLALMGQDLFTALCAEYPGVQRGSRIEVEQDRGTRTNLVVLPAVAWEQLAVEQRNSIGTWLNDLGGRWEIRVGAASADRERVLEAEAVITSRQWNDQLK